MDAKDTRSDIRALNTLYGLLRNDGDGISNTDSNLLDDHSRVVLKNLLDAASERVLKVHTEVIADQVEESTAFSPTQPDDSSEGQLISQSRLSATVQGNQGWDSRKMNGLDATLWKEKRSTTPPSSWISRAGAVEQSVPASGRQKRCRVCRRNTVESTGEMHFYDVVVLNSNRLSDQQKKESGGYLWNKDKEIKSSSLNNKWEESSEMGRKMRPLMSNLDFDSIVETDISSSDRTLTTEGEATNKVDDCLFKEAASEAIKQIELCFSSLARLHQFEKDYFVPETKSAMPTRYANLVCELPSQRVVADPMYYWLPYLSANNFIPRGMTLQSDVSGESRESIDGCEVMFPTKKVNKIYGKNAEAIIDKMESPKWNMSPDDGTCNSSALDSNKPTSHGTTPSLPPTYSKMERLYQSHMAMEDERTPFQTYKPSGTCMMNLNNTKNINPSVHFCFNGLTLGARGKNHPPIILGKTKPSQLLVSVAQHNDGILRNRQQTSVAATTCLQHQESDSTATDSYSNWSSQQTSSRDSDDGSEEYSSRNESRELQYTTSSRSSGGCGSPLSHGTGNPYSSCTSNSNEEEEVCSFSSGDGTPQVTSSSSSTSEDYSSNEHPIRSYARPTHVLKQSTPKKSGPSRIHKAYGINHEIQYGVWKRLKDRLAIILHLHHHHHHHHHHGDRANDRAKMSRNSSLDKAINFKRQDKAYGEKAIKKMKKSAVQERRQHSHFHGLMEGLLKHIRHSKQSKTGKRSVGHLSKDHHGRNKNLNKSHWWRLLQHHRGSELHNKTHEQSKEKARLKALPSTKRDHI